jgi:hypothetical protein
VSEPAFPTKGGMCFFLPEEVRDQNEFEDSIKKEYTGITIRDYFAAAALQGVFAHGMATGVSSGDEVADVCYAAADAMLKARSTGDE